MGLTYGSRKHDGRENEEVQPLHRSPENKDASSTLRNIKKTFILFLN